jgi:choline kinase
MRALILAAGIGSRLHPLTNNVPKCLVAAGEKSLIQHQIDALRNCGVEDIVLVIGCQGPQVRAHLGSSVRYIENDEFRTTNSIYSLYLAREELNTDIVLFNCDILFHNSVLQRLLDAPFANAVAVDSRAELMANEMNVTTDAAQRITRISKSLDPRDATAQSMQLAKFDAGGAASVRSEVELLIAGGHDNAFPTSAYGKLIAASSLHAVEAGDLPWTEIDSLDDYEKAMGKVLPLLR